MAKFEQTTQSYINGKWIDGDAGRSVKNVNPYDDSLIAEIKLASKSQLKEAFEYAKEAQKAWGKSSAEERSRVVQSVVDYLNEHKDEIVQLISRETGGSILKGNIEHQLAVEVVEEALNYTDKIDEVEEVPGGPEGKVNKIYRKPIGVVSTISPFNFPLNLSLRSIIPAIALGSSVVHKPGADVGIIAGVVIAKAFEHAGLPKGVFNMILTDSKEVGDEMFENPIPELISFTGSTAVGRHIGSIAGYHLKGLALELGGNNPFVVLSDADVDAAVNAAVFGTFIHQGQICMCINRIIVHKDLYETFIEKFTDKVKGLPYGDTADPNTIIGPLINQKQLKKAEEFIENAKSTGARVVLEGKLHGNVMSPSIFADVDNDSDIAQTEIFGPTALVLKASGDDEAMEMAGETEHGLTSAIFTSDLEKGEQLGVALDTGMTHINDQTVNDAPNIPFGGTKGSGVGRFGNPWIVDEFTKMKWVSVQKKERVFPF
ncbi:MAG TPA: aldehyde dehydrogenase family protein [Virgibacillus sp.]|nr:aldehyde dehydrogenase family protein [Virgibacillus sp.]HLR68280.1 aldehyde dehydrogenase family protein [Virgibacillus sp.]